MPRARKSPKAAAPYNTGQPAAAPTGMPYGEHQASIASQRALPAAGPTSISPPVGSEKSTAGGPPPPDQTPAPADPAALLAAAQGYDAGAPIGLGTTNRPNEPITAGLPFGPGAGPEALGIPDPNQQDIQAWRPYLPALEFLSSQPGATASTRNFVRRLRSAMPPAATAQ